MTPAFKPMIARRSARITRGALVAAVLAGFAVTQAAAQSAIKVLVNDDPITTLDIQQRTKMISVFTRGQQGEKQAIDQLIEERLMLQEAKRRNVTVSDADVDAELSNRARGAKLTGDQFLAALRQAGVSAQTFKDFLRSNLAWSQIVRARFRATVNVTDQDVTSALTSREAPAEEDKTAVEYKVQPILFVIPTGAAAAAETQRRAEANAFRAAFKGCDQSLQQAAGAPDIVVKPLVRRESGQLAPDLKKALGDLAIGATTEPERVPEGIQIVALCEKNPIAGQSEASVAVREEISSERGQLLARRYLRDLKSDAVIEYR